MTHTRLWRRDNGSNPIYDDPLTVTEIMQRRDERILTLDLSPESKALCREIGIARDRVRRFIVGEITDRILYSKMFPRETQSPDA